MNMTQEQMRSKFQDFITAENADADKYETLAEQHPDIAGILRDIAKDERSHVRLLKHILEHTA